MCVGIWGMTILYFGSFFFEHRIDFAAVGIVLFGVSWIFWNRKKRYEKLRIRILFRNFWLYLTQEKLI